MSPAPCIYFWQFIHLNNYNFHKFSALLDLLVWWRSWVCSESVKLEWAPFFSQLGCREMLVNEFPGSVSGTVSTGCPPCLHRALGAAQGPWLTPAQIKGNLTMKLASRLWQNTSWPSNSKNPWGSADSRSTINMKNQMFEAGSTSDAPWFKPSTERAAAEI